MTYKEGIRRVRLVRSEKTQGPSPGSKGESPFKEERVKDNGGLHQRNTQVFQSFSYMEGPLPTRMVKLLTHRVESRSAPWKHIVLPCRKTDWSVISSSWKRSLRFPWSSRSPVSLRRSKDGPQKSYMDLGSLLREL